MAKAIAVYQGGIVGLKQVAIRFDGAKFERFQNKTIYGYQWSKWRFSGKHEGEVPEKIYPDSCNYLRRIVKNARLPN